VVKNVKKFSRLELLIRVETRPEQRGLQWRQIDVSMSPQTKRAKQEMNQGRFALTWAAAESRKY